MFIFESFSVIYQIHFRSSFLSDQNLKLSSKITLMSSSTKFICSSSSFIWGKSFESWKLLLSKSLYFRCFNVLYTPKYELLSVFDK